MTKKNEVVEVEQPQALIVPSRYAPTVTSIKPKELEEKLKNEESIRKIIDKYIKKQMLDGTDYGTIKIEKKDKYTGRVLSVTESKPTLFKAGAEKMCSLFKVRSEYEQDVETWEMLGRERGVVCYKCYIIDGEGRRLGEGKGASVVNPEKFWDFDVNKQVKIAKKRAFVDAVLTTFSLSEKFTQDYDDEDSPKAREQKKQAKADQKASESAKARETASEPQKVNDKDLVQLKPYIEKIQKCTTKEALTGLQAEIRLAKDIDGKQKYTLLSSITYKLGQLRGTQK